MTSEQILVRLRDDFPFYASRCLRIRAKVAIAGQKVIPFVLNRAQMYLHQRLEDQRRRTGRVRALVLKGRQQGCCLDPNTPVLTADLKWVKIKDLRVGQELVACDEMPGKNMRKMRTSKVVKKWKTRRPAYRITFHDGRSVVCSAEHRWLSKKSQTQAAWRSIGGSGKSADGRDGLKIGDQVRSITKVWGNPTLEDYWFGGMIDGEGSLDFVRRTGVDLAVSQRAGAVLDRMLDHCDFRDYPFCVVADAGPRKTKFGRQPVFAISISNISEMFRLIGLSRPSRFLGTYWWDNKRMPDNGWLRIESIEPLGDTDLVDIETTTQTYVANGLMSHNSTYIGGRYFHKTTFNPGMKTFILAHRDDATDNLFKQVKRYYENLPQAVQPSTSYSNRKELIFDRLDSAYGLGTAGSGSVGRSDTIDLLHGSEAAFWANVDELRTGVLQAAEMAQEIVFESTANGYDPMFFPMWQDAEAGKGQYEAIFIPWYWQDEYRAPVPANFIMDEEEAEYAKAYNLSPGQMVWRRNKIIELKDPLLFKQEYPATAAEAFQVTGTESFISSREAAAARRYKNIRPIGAHIVGVDPAREGEDRAVFIHRRGRVAWGLKKEATSNSMHIVGRIKGLLDAKDDRVDMIFLDRGGEGGAIYDRLCELGYEERVTLVNFGSRKTVLEPDKYFNKRAEMWGLMRDWLREPNGCEIPDLDELQADLTAPSFKYDSEQKVVLEKKEDIKKRGLRSPDCFVAGTQIKTDAGDRPIESVRVGDRVLTPFGYQKVVATWESKTDKLTEVLFSQGETLVGKGKHNVFTWDNGGQTRLDALSMTNEIETFSHWGVLLWKLTSLSFIGARGFGFKQAVDTFSPGAKIQRSDFFIAGFGRMNMDPYQTGVRSTTLMGTGETTTSQISALSMDRCTAGNTCFTATQTRKPRRNAMSTWGGHESPQQTGTGLKKASLGIENTGKPCGKGVSLSLRCALFAEKVMRLSSLQEAISARLRALKNLAIGGISQKFVRALFVAKSLWQIVTGRRPVVPVSVRTKSVEPTPVYNLTLENHNAYYANNVLVFNCADALALTFAFPVKPAEPQQSRARTDYDVLNYGTPAARMDYDVLGV